MLEPTELNFDDAPDNRSERSWTSSSLGTWKSTDVPKSKSSSVIVVLPIGEEVLAGANADGSNDDLIRLTSPSSSTQASKGMGCVFASSGRPKPSKARLALSC